MNKGLLRAFERKANSSMQVYTSNTEPVSVGTGRQANRLGRRPLIYVPIYPLDIVANATFTADTAFALSPAIGGNHKGTGSLYGDEDVFAIPSDVVALDIFTLINSTSVGVTEVYIHDYNDQRVYPTAPFATHGGGAVHAYGGKVAGHWGVGGGMVYTGGSDGTQFLYSVGWSAGTTALYIRCRGYYVEAD